MEYMIVIIVVLAAALVISMIFMTFYLFKNGKAEKKPNTTVIEVPEIKSNDEHIQDFYDINRGKENKVFTFDEFEGEVHTVGVDFGSSLLDSNKIESVIESNNENTPVSNISEDFDNFRTVSLDEQSNEIRQENQIRYDETLNMVDINSSPSVATNINVTLKYKDGDSNKVIKMITSQITVGRGIGNDLLFSRDSFTSRNHGIFTIRNNQLYLKDLNSKNGTFINKNKRVDGEVLIEDSCEVTFGDAVVEVMISK